MLEKSLCLESCDFGLQLCVLELISDYRLTLNESN
jgi:hypothetical protein